MPKVEKPLPHAASIRTELGCAVSRTLPVCLLYETVTDAQQISLRGLASLRGVRKISSSNVD